MNESIGMQRHLLPNEEVLFSCPTQSGFLVLSNRRIVFVKKQGQSGYLLDGTVPYDSVLSLTVKKTDRLILSGSNNDEHGVRTKETTSIELKVGDRDATLDQCQRILDEYRTSESSPPTQSDLSYLGDLPDSLTRNAILDLNTVLRDQPVHDELVHEAKKFLGGEPFIIEESLRDGNDRKNGVLFAAGTRGYYLIRGKKQGRFMVDVSVDTVEWDNIHSVVYRWQDVYPIIHVTYSPTKGGKTITSQYFWSPPTINESDSYPWLLQPLNGPWIFADVMYKYSGKPRRFPLET